MVNIFKKSIIFLLVFFISVSSISALDNPNKAVVDITKMSISEIQSAVDKGYLSYELIVKLYLERIEKYDEQYNSIITLNDNALEEAKKLDIEYKEKGRRSLIHGLPVVVKDNIDVVSMPTTIGTLALKDAYPKTNAPAVQKLIDAGAIIIAKTNMSEFAFEADSSYSSYGFVNNAYDTKYSSYGSSGGTAVAVAANFAVAGLGTDTGASVRVPSSANSLIGLRPTYGSISGEGMAKFDASRDTIGVISKYVEDNAIIYNIIDNNNTDFTTNLKTKNLDGITIGVVKEFMSLKSLGKSNALGATDAEIVDLMEKAITSLEEQGAKIVYIDEIWNGYYQFMSETLCYDFNQYIKNTNSKIQSLNDLIKNGEYVSSISSYQDYYCNSDYRTTSAYATYLKNNKNFENSVLKIYTDNDLDVVIYPTIKNKLLTNAQTKTYNVKTPSYTVAPATGMPSINVPIGFSENLPYGMEIMGKDNNESVLYTIAKVYETNTNYYKNPDIAPALYTIPSSISKLMQYHENANEQVEYKEINDNINTFFTTYTTLDNDTLDKTINELINSYDDVGVNIIKNQQTKKQLLTIIIITSSLIVVLCIITLIISLRYRKKLLKEKKVNN